jgi:hypothetical protein
MPIVGRCLANEVFDVREIEESRAIEAIRTLLDTPAARQRAVTSEWLAGRLSLPLAVCEAALSRLVASRQVRRVRRSKAAPIYVRADRRVTNLGGHLVIAMLVLGLVTAAVFIALNSRYVLLGAEALAIGLIIAFAWLDAELRDTKPPRPPT